jgi:hypothetical protein
LANKLGLKVGDQLTLPSDVIGGKKEGGSFWVLLTSAFRLLTSVKLPPWTTKPIA